jgi:tRNA A-37 threonylcarbamoyl transferase component Bud32
MRQGKELDKKIRRHRAVLKSKNKKEMIGVPKPSVSVGYKTMVLKTSPL